MIEVNNLTSYSINKKLLRETASEVFKKESVGRCSARDELSIALVGQKRIKELNKRYRGKNRPTDVLSFEGEKGLGEVVICPDEVRRNAKRFNSNFKKELNLVLIHGILHLFGYDEEAGQKKKKIMEERQKYYLLRIR